MAAEIRAKLRPTTYELYESQLRFHLLPVFGHLALAEITSPIVRRWLTAMEKRAKPGPVTRAKVYRLLRIILNTAVADDLIVKNPCNIKGAGAEQLVEGPVATVEQVAKIADEIEPCYRALVLVATYGTLRFGELFGLQRKHIDLTARTVTVEQQITHLRSGEMLIGAPKTAAGKRVVSLPASVIPDLERHQFVGTADGAWVFRGPKGAVPRKSNWSAYWRRVCANAEVDGLHFHDLRHIGNTLAASTGASTKELMSRIGHSSARAALIYQHATRERDHAIAAGLDRIITASPARTR
jgi:integrase